MGQSVELPPHKIRKSAAAAAAEPESTSRHTCLVCHKRFASARKHHSHELRHRSKMLGRYRCTTCSKCFVQKSALVTHARIHTGERPYRCLHCDASFGDVSSYNKHKRVHSGDRPYVCIACNKAFTQSGMSDQSNLLLRLRKMLAANVIEKAEFVN
ncbi:zinc finger protein 70 [Dermacentor silvarum]|uniref:zinc finger protein 70 n=1 Tax=Dermacentor silvarum TaxID=543639 RepID=UPI00189815EE|nr:zinc finger protein 70 [Dermacentor silvarum]